MSDIVTDPRQYFRGLTPRRSPLLHRLENEAAREKIPIVGPMVGELLYLAARFSGAHRVLELGAAIGYSTIFLGEACREAGGRLTTVEADPAMAARARENLGAAGLSGVVELVEGDALAVIKTRTGPFDLVFLDIEKDGYVRALEPIARLLRPAGLLVADNTGFKDADAFNRAVNESPKWRAVQLFSFLPGHSPEQDGICLALSV